MELMEKYYNGQVTGYQIESREVLNGQQTVTQALW